MSKRNQPKKISSTNKPTLSRRELKNINAFGIFTVIIAVLYGYTLFFGFTWFDDDAILLRNVDYVSDISNIGQALVRDAEFRNQSMELYRPLQNVSLMIDAAFGGYEKPGVFHFTNTLLHLLSVFLFFLFLKKLNVPPFYAFLGGVILAVHPIFAYAVCWIPARGDLLLSLFALLSLLCFCNYIDRRRPLDMFLHLLFFALALMSKESAVVLVPFAALLLLLREGRFKFEKYMMLSIAVYSIAVFLFLHIRSFAIAPIKEGGFNLAGMIYNFPVLPEVLMKFFLPYSLTTLPFYSLVVTLSGVALIGLFLFLLMKSNVSKSDILLGVSWFLLFSIPAMVYNPEWSDYIYDYLFHRSYLPLMGVVFLFVKMIEQFFDSKPEKFRSFIITVVGVVLVFVNFSFSANYKDPLTFWNYAVKTNPKSPFAHTYLGGTLFFNGDKAGAIKSYDKAIGLKPDFSEALFNRGIALASEGKHKQAISDFDKRIELLPNDTVALKYRAESLIAELEFEKALGDLKYVQALGDTSENVSFRLGLVHMLVGNYKESSTLIDSLIAIKPTNQQYLRLGALSSLMAGDPVKAVKRYKMVRDAGVSDPNLLSNLGYALWEVGDYSGAFDVFTEATEGAPEDLSINLGLLITHYKMGNREQVAEALLRTYILNPKLRNFDTEMADMIKSGYLFTPNQIDAMRKAMDYRFGKL